MTKSPESIRVTITCGILPLKRECTYSNYLMITFEEFNLKAKKEDNWFTKPWNVMKIVHSSSFYYSLAFSYSH